MRNTFNSILAAAALTVMGSLSITAAHAADVLKSGSFVGVSKHKSAGSLDIVKDGDIVKIVIKDDFALQDAPTPRLAWGNNGYQRATIFGTLGKFSGMQEYIVPAGTDLTQFNEFWIWCEKFNVGLAVARLQQ